jgi:hypothetical protein
MSDHDMVLLEDINHKFDAIMEGQALLAPMARKLDNVEERLIRVESDVKIIKKVLTGHSRQLRKHDKQIAALKQAT